jgi:hypothetical protein
MGTLGCNHKLNWSPGLCHLNAVAAVVLCPVKRFVSGFDYLFVLGIVT